MAVRELRYFGDPVLKTAADPVTRFDKSVQALVQDLLDTVDAPGRAGLAAPQIGVSLRVFSYNVKGEIGYVINPEIVELSEQTHEIDEGCLSVPQLWFPTVRAKRAVVRGVDLRNEPVTVQGEDVMAQCLQHETDHLDGLLYLDRLTSERRRAALREARQRDWFWSR
ncbi:peptide deformylase [Prauserella muralis]|uniref:Peptide deformylase n=1 Tax=Prauserella muralis TaxID=588067 RepID=A0A2V4AI34_9PSEU|nr:peptide deformylase [Prauserella muralis]PXY19602.1 peptide deformylase [Prauserella muralis]TWE29606.1 peptide deformylase [Prauserella muralis]